MVIANQMMIVCNNNFEIISCITVQKLMFERFGCWNCIFSKKKSLID